MEEGVVSRELGVVGQRPTDILKPVVVGLGAAPAKPAFSFSTIPNYPLTTPSASTTPYSQLTTPYSLLPHNPVPP
jgi:hypothetical protein